jgi:FMN-dependent NADH-azoreductase
MSTLLHIDASPLGGASISRHLSNEFEENWRKANPGGNVVRRDLTTTGLTAIDATWIGASYTPPADRTDAQRELLALSDTLIAELRDADEVVIGVPMHNFTIASSLRLWIDLVVRVGETFSYGPSGPAGLVENKRVTFVVASGGVYGPGTAMESFNFVEPYLRTVFGFIGITDTQFVVAGGVSQIRSGVIDREAFLKPHVQSIQAAFQPVSVGA